MDNMILKLGIFIFIIGAAGIILVQIAQSMPIMARFFSNWNKRKIEKQRIGLRNMMLFADPKKIGMFNLISQTASIIAGGIIGAQLGSVVIGVLLGIGVGFLIPSILIKNMILSRKAKFKSQISDGLMILSSCLKGGLSLLQAIEALVEELPPPISQEFGVILRENKMGVPLEESFDNLNKRIPSEELNLLTTAILVARETGGDITQLFTTLINTIRAKIKISDNVKTLSMQGKIQGIVMSILPIAFCIMVYSFNPNYFDVMLQHPMGRSLLVYAVISEIVGVFLIKIFSRVNL